MLEKETKELVIIEELNNVFINEYENKDYLIKCIEDIESNNKDVKSLTTYQLLLKDIKNDLINNHKRIYKFND